MVTQGWVREPSFGDRYRAEHAGRVGPHVRSSGYGVPSGSGGLRLETERAVSYLPSLSEVEHACACVLTALYLPGAPRGLEVRRAAWREALARLRSETASLRTAARHLQRSGFEIEGLCLESPGLLAWAERQVLAGRVLTGACAEYPANWERKLGGSAPPALWRRGRMPRAPWIAIVGSRHVEAEVRAFARKVGEEAARIGHAVVSGAASGCDRAAAAGAARAWRQAVGESWGKRFGGAVGDVCPLAQILPCGMAMRPEGMEGCVLSPFGPQEPFSGPNAMQRNVLIYALGEAAFIVHARFGEGGTWRGAVEARRRRLCRLVVRADGSRASEALLALGAARLETPGEMEAAIRCVAAQGELDF